jgi:hypothetical protein
MNKPRQPVSVPVLDNLFSFVSAPGTVDSGSASGSGLSLTDDLNTKRDRSKESSTLEKPNVLEWIQKASQFAISSTISQDNTAGGEHNAHQLLALLAQRLPTALASHSLSVQMCTTSCARLTLDCQESIRNAEIREKDEEDVVILKDGRR